MILNDPWLGRLCRALFLLAALALLLGLGGFWWRSASERHGVLLQGTVDSLLASPWTPRQRAGRVLPVVRVTLPDSSVRSFRNPASVPTDALLRGQRVLVVYRAEFPSALYVRGTVSPPGTVLLWGAGVALLSFGLAFWGVPRLARRID